MSSNPSRRGDDRVFVRDGRRHYRRQYSLTEPRIGAVILVLLAAVVAWVAWKGAHPDPELSAESEMLLQAGDAIQPLDGRPEGGTPVGRASGGGDAADRGVLPAGLAITGWTEGAVSHFDPANLYVKINGREDYYKSFGFVRLTTVSLVNDANSDVVVDIELFDLGEPANALGAYAGERSPEIAPEITAGGMAHFDRNALYVTRGRHYLRAIGSEESPLVRAELEHLKLAFEENLTGEALPGAYAVFVGGMGMDPGRVSFVSENAFSFGFATNVYTALLADEETEVFVTDAGSPEAATTLAAQFAAGFLEYGNAVEGSHDPVWVEDRYINTLAGAVADRAWVIGVRGAPDRAAAEKALNDLRRALGALAEEGAPGE